MKTRTEYDNCEHLTRQLVSVPHSEIKAKVDAENKDKAQRNKRKAKIAVQEVKS